MSLPGFTAETTLAMVGVGYHTTALASPGADGIVPQSCFCLCLPTWVCNHHYRFCCQLYQCAPPGQCPPGVVSIQFLPQPLFVSLLPFLT
jgi:hypothetical protein